MDAGRAGEYFVEHKKPDDIFLEILYKEPPLDPSHAYSRDVLIGVLEVVVALGD